MRRHHNPNVEEVLSNRHFIDASGKVATTLALLRRKRGATVKQIANAIDWQTRVRQLGFEVESAKRKTGSGSTRSLPEAARRR